MMPNRSMYIQRYRIEVRPSIAASPDSEVLFLTRNGLPFNESWLSTTISRYVCGANLGKRGSCHLFRHTLATLMLENGADIRFIQSMLGHVDLKSTQIYTHVAIKQLKKVHRKTHPGCRTRPNEEQAAPSQSQAHGDSPSAQATLFTPGGADSATEAAARYLLLRQQLTEDLRQH